VGGGTQRLRVSNADGAVRLVGDRRDDPSRLPLMWATSPAISSTAKSLSDMRLTKVGRSPRRVQPGRSWRPATPPATSAARQRSNGRFRPSLVSLPRTVHVPYTLERDEDGVWCAHAWLGSCGGSNGNGGTPDEAIANLRVAVQMVLDEDGVPEQLQRTLDLEVA
jgi:hypothetical protein